MFLQTGRRSELVQRRCCPGVFNERLSRRLCRLYCLGMFQTRRASTLILQTALDATRTSGTFL